MARFPESKLFYEYDLATEPSLAADFFFLPFLPIVLLELGIITSTEDLVASYQLLVSANSHLLPPDNTLERSQDWRK